MQPEHTCPGCDEAVAAHHIACKPCWERLPKRTRREVTAAFLVSDLNPRRYLELRGAAQGWFADHPPRATAAVHASINRPNR